MVTMACFRGAVAHRAAGRRRTGPPADRLEATTRRPPRHRSSRPIRRSHPCVRYTSEECSRIFKHHVKRIRLTGTELGSSGCVWCHLCIEVRRMTLRILLLALVVSSAAAAARDNGQWAANPPHIRQWFQQLRQPDHPRLSCCGEADAFEADNFEV